MVSSSFGRFWTRSCEFLGKDARFCARRVYFLSRIRTVTYGQTI